MVGFIDFDRTARNESGGLRKYNAAAVVRDGQVLQRARGNGEPGQPLEIQFLEFPSAVALDEYMARRAPAGPN